MQPSITWKKSSYSSAAASECLEAGMRTGSEIKIIFVRDSKKTQSPVLQFGKLCWINFLQMAESPTTGAVCAD
ncbi:DUF397 domain-containing protein [Streptomyces sp. NPDC090106]|uniref:DUF397 domain-containing protein n=1 Tax=Streptomyces sp. NPDC090106 TaxID=3365946 RepID=UPI00381A91B5